MSEGSDRRTCARTIAGVVTAVLVVGCSLEASASPSAIGSTAPSAGAEHIGTLAIDGRVDGAATHLVGPVGSREYTFDVEPGGGLLRVAVDLSNRDDCLALELFDPMGSPVPTSGADRPAVCPPDGGGQVFGIEWSAVDPADGRWRAVVTARDVRDLSLRLRAVRTTIDARADRPLLPDLVPWLPWEFGFAAPASESPGTAHDRANGPTTGTDSCHPTEEAHVRCLRFSAGVYNVGDGPLSIVFRDDLAFQHLYRSDATPLDHTDNERDGRFEEREAGSGEWHPFHFHRHLAEFVLYELFAVGEGDALAAIGTGHKHGFCTFSQQMADWASAAQDPQFATFPDVPYCEEAMTLERGYGDIYRWQRPGQYVNYASVADVDGSMRAGRYLLRFTVDPSDHVAEKDEANNVGYALVEVVDGGGLGEDAVVVCEQGMGSAPWDEAATPMPDRFEWARRAADPASAAPACS